MADHVKATRTALKISLYAFAIALAAVTGAPLNSHNTNDAQCDQSKVVEDLLTLFKILTKKANEAYDDFTKKIRPSHSYPYDNSCGVGYKPCEFRAQNLKERLDTNVAILKEFDNSLRNMVEREENNKTREIFAKKFHILREYTKKALDIIRRPGCKSTQTNLSNGLFIKFSGNQRSSNICNISDKDEQEITVLKHLRIVSKEMVLDLEVRQVTGL